MVELHNEINPADSQAVAWANTMLPVLRQLMPGTLETLSVANIGPQNFYAFTQEITATPDFWSYHYYGTVSQARLGYIQQAAGSVPLFIGEAGYSTSQPTGDSTAVQEQAQAEWYQELFAAAAALGLPCPAPWTLNDFEPDAIPGRTTADNPAQYGYGLFRVDGTPKPAEAVVAQAFSAG
jgi:hypothetical protein